ncbi:DUF5664 domain-containing protein [Comamonas thiooxydans]|uniref:dATP/dGTP diphosphohydrolase domain-containing protein n=1 Tax=Comamonas thiooxydans TaxID=363952 RepID=UPI000A2D02DA|nr:dATP/dGTP diphosphohydrolase domain-containing protein [Comamonas thiooxydans]BDR10695.1 DUF5664 domain-containing protein [Comamonas thiooxydans]
MVVNVTTGTIEQRDPNGCNPHEPGAKLDAGKARPDLVLNGFPRALLAVAEVAAYGARKYTEEGWRSVPDGRRRYVAAKDRHRLQGAIEASDSESGLPHLAHEAWNALAALELALSALEQEGAGC